jgi:hypothetical protein
MLLEDRLKPHHVHLAVVIINNNEIKAVGCTLVKRAVGRACTMAASRAHGSSAALCGQSTVSVGGVREGNTSI